MGDELPPATNTTEPSLSTGRRKVGRRPTKQEQEERQALCNDLLHKGLRASQIKRLCADRWGVDSRSVEAYLSRARAALVAEIGEDKAGLRANAYAVYRGVVADVSQPAVVRLRAQENIDRLLGLSAPTKVSVTDPSGTGAGTIKLDGLSQLPDEALKALAAAYDVLDRTAGDAKAG